MAFIDSVRVRASALAPTRIFAGSSRRWHRLERHVKSRFLWHRVFRATSYLKSALWTAPLIALLAVLAIAPFIRVLDQWSGWTFPGLGVEGAQAMYQTVITLTLSFMVFTFGSLLVAIQVAGGQLTPRVIATTLLRDNVVRVSVGLFVFALLFSVVALDRTEAKVYQLVTFITGVLGVACIAAFLFLIDYAARLLRPVSILARIGNQGLNVIDAVYPHSRRRRSMPTITPPISAPRDGSCITGGTRRSCWPSTSRRSSRRRGGPAELIEFIPQVGDFVAYEEPLFALYGGATAVADRMLVAAVAFGPERTLEQDPMFALRIMVDIALKALSPAINDPTTAVLAIDQIHRFLRAVGQRQLRGEVLTDERGAARVIFRTPNWEDFVHVACSEIRACGREQPAGGAPHARMLDNLCLSLPKHRHAALLEAGDLLDRRSRRCIPLPQICASHGSPTRKDSADRRAPEPRMPRLRWRLRRSGLGRACRWRKRLRRPDRRAAATLRNRRNHDERTRLFGHRHTAQRHRGDDSRGADGRPRACSSKPSPAWSGKPSTAGSSSTGTSLARRTWRTSPRWTSSATSCSWQRFPHRRSM